MTRAVLFICHGTRNPRGVAASHALMDAVTDLLQSGQAQNRHPDRSPEEILFHRAFLELVHPDIGQGLQTCLEQGATEIILAPILLFAAGHWKMDIPSEIESFMASHPKIVVRQSEALGINQLLMDVVEERCSTGGSTVEELALLLVGRGNRDREATAEFEELARHVRMRCQFRQVETAVMVGLGNTVEQGLNSCCTNASTVVVVPYLLFPGHVLEELQTRVALYQATNPSGVIRIAPCLWPDERIVEAFADRIRAILFPQPY